MSENTFSNRVKCTTDSELFLSYQFLVGRMKVGGWVGRMKKNELFKKNAQNFPPHPF